MIKFTIKIVIYSIFYNIVQMTDILFIHQLIQCLLAKTRGFRVKHALESCIDIMDMDGVASSRLRSSNQKKKFSSAKICCDQ